MIERYTDLGVTWVDLSSPTQEESRQVMEEFNVPPELLWDLSSPVPRSEASAADHTVKITIDFPVFKRKDVDGSQEIKFLISKKTLITVRYEDIPALHKFAKDFEVLATLHKTDKNFDGGALFLALMSSMYEGLTSTLDFVDSRVDEIERGMFEGRERDMVFEISNTSQTIIIFRQILSSHSEVLDAARPMFVKLFGKEFDQKIDHIASYYQYLLRRVSALSASIQDLRATNDSLLSTKQNQTMQVLTVMAFVTYPLALLASIFGMNTTYTPISGSPHDFWIIAGIMFVAGLALYLFFKFRHWI